MAHIQGDIDLTPFYTAPQRTDAKRQAINKFYLLNETTIVNTLLSELQEKHTTLSIINDNASALVKKIRSNPQYRSDLDAFLLEYDLSTKEGIVLMCIAEALLRIPDTHTADNLIRDKLLSGDWQRHLEHSDSLLVNASTWGLMLTGKVVNLDHESNDIQTWLKRMVSKSGEPIIRAAMRHAMAILGQQFVMGETIASALKRSQQPSNQVFRYSFDMLGEAAITLHDAEKFFIAYQDAIQHIAASTSDDTPLYAKPSISVKLSALHPRYQLSQQQRVRTELHERLLTLAQLAKQHNLCLTIDAEESERLELSLDLFESVFTDDSLKGWNGLGLAVQAYQKRAYAVLDWLISLAERQKKKIPIRLVKGAYWDSEIKRAQELGLDDYPVFTRKHHTDLSYQTCALKLLENTQYIFPQFATHNAYTIAYIMQHSSAEMEFEFQKLHGMGVALYHYCFKQYEQRQVHCRVYAPVGGHKDLLPYLVRRLLENGANTSFINRIQDEQTPIEQVVSDPVALTLRHKATAHPKIPLPREMYGVSRLNSTGINLFDEEQLNELNAILKQYHQHQWHALPIVRGKKMKTTAQAITSPMNHQQVIGHVHLANEEIIQQAIDCTEQAFPMWSKTPVSQRSDALRQCAVLIEKHFQQCLALLMFEGGKTMNDAVAETREAIDFCRYYAIQAEQLMLEGEYMAGPTGEQNMLYLSGRGTFACISPWNFPLAIFLGQISAALVTGNCVIAKPAGQTPLIAAFIIDVLYQAGIPKEVLQFIPAHGSDIGRYLIPDPRIKGVAFTGSTQTAREINLTLAQRPSGIAPLIAETGGQNAMLVDSSALPEQVVLDVIQSAFNSAGQRCSALRVLFLQQDIADKIINLLKGAMQELQLGDPRQYSTDIGPVIDAAAQASLEQHIQNMTQQAKLIYQTPLKDTLQSGSYIQPTVFEIEDITQLEHEVFGPILHIIRYDAQTLEQAIERINQTGYGLTLGIHSRIESTINTVIEQAQVGNIYVNRNMIGAVVGVQPFGGEGLSGTGPKAGGPHYLHRFCTERTVSTNTAAVGGNTSLLTLENE